MIQTNTTTTPVVLWIALLSLLSLGGVRGGEARTSSRSLQVFDLASFGIPTDFNLNPLEQVEANAVLPSSVPSVATDIVPLRVPLKGIRRTFSRLFEGGDSGNGLNSAVAQVTAAKPPVMNEIIPMQGFPSVMEAQMMLMLNATEAADLMDALDVADEGLDELEMMYDGNLDPMDGNTGFDRLINGINADPEGPPTTPAEAFGLFQGVGFSVLGSLFGLG